MDWDAISLFIAVAIANDPFHQATDAAVPRRVGSAETRATRPAAVPRSTQQFAAVPLPRGREVATRALHQPNPRAGADGSGVANTRSRRGWLGRR